jgi:hypothetical protein
MEDEENTGPGYDPIAEEFATCVHLGQLLVVHNQLIHAGCKAGTLSTAHSTTSFMFVGMSTIWTARSQAQTCTTWRTSSWLASWLNLGVYLHHAVHLHMLVAALLS